MVNVAWTSTRLQQRNSSMTFSRFLAALAAGATFAAVVPLATFASSDRPPSEQQSPAEQVMLILRGIAKAERPRGALDDAAALEYARRVGFHGEVLDVAADFGAASTQVRMALERIRGNDRVTALYGFSGGGYNARNIWAQLS